MNRSPLLISFMFACHVSQDPAEHLGLARWTSSAGQDAREWLFKNGLINEDNRSTERGKAWVMFICETPLPLPVWTIPVRENGEVHVVAEAAE